MDDIERASFMSPETEQNFRCPVCKTFWGTPNSDGIVDRPVITPCNHIFGEKCIKQLMAEETETLNSPGCPHPKCGRLLVHQGCRHTIKPVQIPLHDYGDRLMVAGMAIPMPFPLEEWNMPENCRPCASKKLRFRSIYSDLEKHLKNFLIRKAWVSEGVAKRGLSQGLLDEVNENIRKCRADMEELKPSLAEEWENFVTYRFGW